jgi:hypothetical protein
MFMARRNLQGVCIVAVGLLILSPAARAGERDNVFKFGKAIVEAAHPTGVSHKLKDYSTRGDRLTIEMDWKGGFLDTPYTSAIKIDFESVGGKLRIKSIDYRDDAIISYNRGNIDRLIRQFNDD